MYRVPVALCLLISLAGCRLNSSMLASGFAGSTPQETASLRPAARQATHSADSTVRTASADKQKLAKLDDQAPKGSFDRAPAGALSDRDYSATRLDPEQA